jgi:hypothetical protein
VSSRQFAAAGLKETAMEYPSSSIVRSIFVVLVAVFAVGDLMMFAGLVRTIITGR